MKRTQWTLPAGHRATQVAHLWVFPLFISARKRIDLLNDKALDPLFKIYGMFKPENVDYSKSDEIRLEQSLTWSGYQTVAGLISIYIAEQFGRLNANNHIPFAAYLAAHPIPMVETVEQAKAACRSIYELAGPWRAYAYDNLVITAHCTGLTDDMKRWQPFAYRDCVRWYLHNLDKDQRQIDPPLALTRVILPPQIEV